MGDLKKDKRFSGVLTDPRFKGVPRSQRKVKIDKRFQAMFTDSRFQLKYAVDKRGRKLNQSQADDYKKFYELASESDSDEDEANDENEAEGSDDGEAEKSSGSEEEADDEEKEEEPDGDQSEGDSSEDGSGEDVKLTEDEKRQKLKEKEEAIALSKEIDSVHMTKMTEKVKEKLQDMSVDYARGIGDLMTESSSDESSSEESESEMIVHPWGEMDKDAEVTEEVTKRLAVCNMDWDRITATDLMVLFTSFLPSDGFIESVTIYPSDFGLERMKEEEIKGPKELVDDPKLRTFDESDSDGNEYCTEKLREYQIKRLKYYYAVVVCDNPETANKLYAECDGLEYESSATRIDLRFIPDDMTFDTEPKESCTSVPDVTKYQPRLFANSALQQGSVNLTWDETDPTRVEFNKKLAGGEVNEDDLKAFVAVSESSGDSEDEKHDAEEEPARETNETKNPISKYKALLAEIQKEEEKKKRDVEMKVSWGVGLGSDDDSGDEIGEATTSMLKSDDDSSKSNENTKKAPKKDRKSRKKKGKSSDADDYKGDKELELLLADDEPEESGKSHFNLKGILDSEKETRRKKKAKRKAADAVGPTPEDNFKVDVKDERFSALYSSHHFNIDPADSHFTKTRGMEQFIAEKQKRRRLESVEETAPSVKQKVADPELSRLVNSVKNKTKGS